jgi:predicted amidohydrolase
LSSLKVATCQFAVSDSIRKNSENIQHFMNQAKDANADIIHFSETALSGYAGEEIKDFSKFNWQELYKHTENIAKLAGQLEIWVVLGSSHRLTEPNKPHNCLYLINPQGQIADRYDKRFCTERDLHYYTPGNHFTVFDVNGVKCALLICFDLRFPELYRQLYKLDVEFVLQSFYNARQDGPSIHTHIMRQTMQCRAATNYFWVSMSNSSRYYSPYPSSFIAPDGKIVNQLRQNTPGMMINMVDTELEFYDPCKNFRQMAIEGRLNNGSEDIQDERSIIRNIF